MSKQYNFKNIRALLTEGFTTEELRRLCYDESNFRPVYNKLAQDTGKATIIDWLLEYTNQTLQIEALLILAKECNPAMYEKYQPYDNTNIISTPSSNLHTNSNRFKKTKARSSKKFQFNISAEGDVAVGGSAIDKRVGSVFVENAQIKGNVYGNIPTNNQQGKAENIEMKLDPTHDSTSAPLSPTTLMIVRVLALVIGVLGIVGSIIWLIRSTPETSFQYLIPLIVIVIAAVLGAMGLLAPDQIVHLLLGSRIESSELILPTENAKPLKDNKS